MYKRLTKKDSCYYDDMDNIDVDEMYNRLAELEDKIENGTLIEMPCKVNDDAIFVVKHEEDWVMEMGYVKAISIDKDGIWISCHYDGGLSYWHKCKDKYLFFKATEAEQKLQELQELKKEL